MSRTLPRLLPLVLLAFALGWSPPADAQSLTVNRREHVASPRTEEQMAAFEAVKSAMDAVFAAQRAHHGEHGRFARAEELDGLPEEVRAIVAISATDDWYVATGGDASSGVLQHVVTLHARDREAADAAAMAHRAETSARR